MTLSLLFSFGSMMVGTLTSNYEYLNLVIVSLMIGVVTNGISVLFSVLGFSIKHYGYPFPYHVFFKDDPSNNKLVFNDEVIEQYRDGLGEILVLNQYKYSRNLLLKIILNVTKKMQSKITIKRQE